MDFLNIEDLVEVTLNDPEDFLKIRETLTRIGVSSKKEKKLIEVVIKDCFKRMETAS